jgi:4-hydroxy-2-oxoheptanedioate aldolase
VNPGQKLIAWQADANRNTRPHFDDKFFLATPKKSRWTVFGAHQQNPPSINSRTKKRPMKTHYSMWLTEPNIMYAEVVIACGVKRFVLDIEHGIFPIQALFNFLAFSRAHKVSVLAKVAGATTEAVQQAIDLGVDGIIIPHILDASHAATLCDISKFPPLGSRSYAGGRTVNYLPPKPDYLATENARVQCYPMIETPQALADVENILALPSVDGIFPGPTDLAITQGQGLYTFDEKSRADLTRCAKAAQAAGKKWIMPAWSAAERQFAVEFGANELVVATQTMLIRTGVQNIQKTLAAEGIDIH